MDHSQLHERARSRGVNPVVCWIVRAFIVPFFLIYFRMSRMGREHIPDSGPVIICANHRSFLDPFVIGTMTRRPIYYVAKKEAFLFPLLSWFLSALGAFPVDRGTGDADTIRTAKQILARGEIVLIFPEGTRIRPGTLGKARRGVGRLALETGAPVVPMAIIGTEAVRRGLRIRPHKVRVRAGRPLRFPAVEKASPRLTAAVTDRIWRCVRLQWEWLGGLAPIRRAAVIGAGRWGTGLAAALSRAGYEVELGCRTQEQAELIRAAGVNERYLPGVQLPPGVTVVRASQLEFARHDLICLAVPARGLPGVMAAHGERIPASAGILVLSSGLVPPLGTLPSAFVAERSRARAVAVLAGPNSHEQVPERGASAVIGSRDRAFARQLRDALTAAGLDVSISSDVTGVELAGCAKDVAALAAAVASHAGPGVAGAAAGKVFAEVDALGRARGARPETFAAFAGTGDLVATVALVGPASSRAGELLSRRVPPAQVAPMLGSSVEAIESVSLLATVARDASVQTPAIDNLAALVEGRIEPARWTETVTAPLRTARTRPVRAA